MGGGGGGVCLLRLCRICCSRTISFRSGVCGSKVGCGSVCGANCWGPTFIGVCWKVYFLGRLSLGPMAVAVSEAGPRLPLIGVFALDPRIVGITVSGGTLDTPAPGADYFDYLDHFEGLSTHLT